MAARIWSPDVPAGGNQGEDVRRRRRRRAREKGDEFSGVFQTLLVCVSSRDWNGRPRSAICGEEVLAISLAARRFMSRYLAKHHQLISLHLPKQPLSRRINSIESKPATISGPTYVSLIRLQVPKHQIKFVLLTRIATRAHIGLLSFLKSCLHTCCVAKPHV